tara:strand:- start:486 stop:674 length:189 start_codon:yes stop_codon:yes gene_type:complete
MLESNLISNYDQRSKRVDKSFCLLHLIPLALIATSIFYVPEQPNQLASICEKYNSVTACNVW